MYQSRVDVTAAGGHILLISFGTRMAAQAWKDQCNIEFDMAISADRQIYAKLGLDRSLHSVWNADSLMFYGEQIAAGRELPNLFESSQEDIHQRGGDFIVGRSAKLAFVYHSKSSVDRPSAQDIINVLQGIKHVKGD